MTPLYCNYYYEVLEKASIAFILLSCEKEVNLLGNHFRVQLFFRSGETCEKIQEFIQSHLKRIYQIATNCLFTLNGRVSIRKTQDKHFIVKCCQGDKVYEKLLSQEELDKQEKIKVTPLFITQKQASCEIIQISLGPHIFKVAQSIRKIYLILQEKALAKKIKESFLFEKLSSSKIQFIKALGDSKQRLSFKKEIDQLYLSLNIRIKEKQQLLWKSVLEQREMIKFWLSCHAIDKKKVPYAFVAILNRENQMIQKEGEPDVEQGFIKRVISIIGLKSCAQFYEIHLLMQILLNKRYLYQSFRKESQKYN